MSFHHRHNLLKWAARRRIMMIVVAVVEWRMMLIVISFYAERSRGQLKLRARAPARAVFILLNVKRSCQLSGSYIFRIRSCQLSWSSPIKVVDFWDLRQSTHHEEAALKVVFFREGLARAVVSILIVLIVLIESAWTELSNGGHVVNFDQNLNSDVKFGLSSKISSCWSLSRPVFNLIDSQIWL